MNDKVAGVDAGHVPRTLNPDFPADTEHRAQQDLIGAVAPAHLGRAAQDDRVAPSVANLAPGTDEPPDPPAVWR